MGVTVEVWRGSTVESRHVVSVAVADAAGRLRARAGDPERPAFARSSVKPVQALPLVEDGVVEAYGLTDEELALCCGSHSGEPRHVAVARSILAKAGVAEQALACGADRPFGEEAALALQEAGETPLRVHNNCSGKHAGMLALAQFHGWPLAGYLAPEHPVQQRMLAVVADWTGLEPDAIGTGVDGCGVVTFAMPMSALARAFARLAGAGRRGAGAPGRIVRAMTAHPEMVGGARRLDTELVRVTGGRILAKVGAEGVYAAAVPGAELGIALKVHDGAKRAAGPALLAVLRALGVLSDEELGRLDEALEPDIVNTRGERVGMIRPVAELEPGDG